VSYVGMGASTVCGPDEKLRPPHGCVPNEITVPPNGSDGRCEDDPTNPNMVGAPGDPGICVCAPGWERDPKTILCTVRTGGGSAPPRRAPPRPVAPATSRAGLSLGSGVAIGLVTATAILFGAWVWPKEGGR